MDKIFITGGSGFISSHFHEVLDQKKVINFDLKEPFEGLDSHYVKGDIRIYDDIKSSLIKHQPDVILALAAEHKDFGIPRDSYFKTNEEGTENICAAASLAGVKKIVFYSSVAVYGNNKIPSTEEMNPCPNLPYGESKLAGEKVLERWAKDDISRSVLIIRPVVVYGERNVANMFKLIQQIDKGRYFNIGAGKNIKSIAYVKNLVDATLYLYKRLQPGIQIYNYADSPQMSSRKIGMTISKDLKKRKPITIPYALALLMGMPFDLLIRISGKDLPISTNRIRKFCTETFHKADKLLATGFVAKFDNIEGLRRMVKWQKESFDSKSKYFEV